MEETWAKWHALDAFVEREDQMAFWDVDEGFTGVQIEKNSKENETSQVTQQYSCAKLQRNYTIAVMLHSYCKQRFITTKISSATLN